MGGIAVGAARDVNREAIGGGEMGVGENCFRCALGDGAALGREQQDVGGIGEKFFEMMGDGDDGGRAVGGLGDCV